MSPPTANAPVPAPMKTNAAVPISSANQTFVFMKAPLSQFSQSRTPIIKSLPLIVRFPAGCTSSKINKPSPHVMAGLLSTIW